VTRTLAGSGDSPSAEPRTKAVSRASEAQFVNVSRLICARSYHFVIAVWRAKETESAVIIALPMRRWTIVGLALALFSMPFVIGLFTAFRVPLTTQKVLLREIILFALAALVLFIIRRKERLGWDSVGLQRPALGNTAIWVLITFVGVALAITLAFGFIKLFGLPMGNVDSKAYDALPTWVLLVVIIRAGFVEELFYRGYSIERLQSLTGSRIFAAGIPLVIFAVSHYRQGQAGIIIAMLTGALLTGVYVYKRNLWITITVHFLGDFIPNILVPLFASRQ
jgi:CAAX protease family protein